MKQKITSLLSQLIKFRENDLLMDIKYKHATEETEYHITELIIGITRYLNDIRYCSDPACPCSPERQIKQHYEPIKEYLQRTKYALYPVYWKVVEEIIKDV